MPWWWPLPKPQNDGLPASQASLQLSRRVWLHDGRHVVLTSGSDASVEPQPTTPDPSDVSFKTRSCLAENEAAIERTVNTEIEVRNALGGGNRKKRKLSNEAMSDYGQAIYSSGPRRCSHDTTPSPTQ